MKNIRKAIVLLFGLAILAFDVAVLLPALLFVIIYGKGSFILFSFINTIGTTSQYSNLIDFCINGSNIYFWAFLISFFVLLAVDIFQKFRKIWIWLMLRMVVVFVTMIGFGFNFFERNTQTDLSYRLLEIPGYQDNIKLSDNRYYAQNNWLIQNSGLILQENLSGEVISNAVSQLSGILAIPYNIRNYDDNLPQYPDLYENKWNDFFIASTNIEYKILRYKWLNSRINSYTTIIDTLTYSVQQEKLLDNITNNLSGVTQVQKNELVNLLKTEDIQKIYNNILIKEYHFTKYLTKDSIENELKKNNARLPVILFDPIETQHVIASYFIDAIKDPSHNLYKSGNNTVNFWCYNMLGRFYINSSIPRLSNFYNRLVQFDNKKKEILKKLGE